MFIPLSQTLFLETARSHLEPNQGIGWVFHISVIDFWARNCLTAPCELEHCHGGESNLWAKVLAISTHSFM
jgi:hypothetical protein